MAMEVIRHSTAHLLAYGSKELYPKAQVTIGLVIEDGFYYDFSYKRLHAGGPRKIEAKMAELAKRTRKSSARYCRATRRWPISAASA